MRNLNRFRSNLGVRRFLIDLNIQLDSVKQWSFNNGFEDEYSTISSQHNIANSFPTLVNDILLLEDRRFFLHRGFEFMSLPRGIKRMWRYGKIGGVSTIDQLLVRTYLQRRERTIGRKTREILLAILLNFHHSKTTILFAYVNCAYFGPGLNGADTAAQVIFGSPASSLSNDQSAFLASLLPYPLPNNILRDLRENGPRSYSSEILEPYRVTNSWWTARVNSRMAYLRDLRVIYSTIS